MKYVDPKTVAAIKADEFATKAIESARLLIYLQHRSWDRIHPDGKLIFDNDEAGISYAALSGLLDTQEPPEVADARVNVGGVNLSVGAIDALQAAFKGAKQ